MPSPTERAYQRGAALPPRERHAALARAAHPVPGWHRWSRLAAWLYPPGVAALYGGAITLSLGGPLALSAILVLVGMAALGLVAGVLRRVVDDMLTTAVGLQRTERQRPS